MSFFDDASLAFLPSGAAGKDGKAYSIKPTDGTGDFTFSRGSNLAATRVGADGLIEKGRENLLLQSNQFDTTWSQNRVDLTSGQSGYDGGSNAWQLQSNDASTTYLEQSVSASGVQTASIYAKVGTADYLAFYASSGARAWFNLNSGSISSSFSNIDTQIENVGNGWYRCSMSYDASTTYVRIYVTDVDGNFTSAIDANIYIQDAQLEIGLAATDVIETGATTGKAGLLEDEPRFDYSGGATCPSLLLEPSRTNILPYTEYMGGTFTLDNVSLDYNHGTSPEGVSNSALLTQTGSSSSNSMYEFGLPTTDGSYTYSIFFKAGTSTKCRFYCGTGVAEDFNPQAITEGYTGGSLNLLFENYQNGWWRASATQTLSGASTNRFSFYPDRNNTGGNVEVWGAQVEDSASYPTSYIPNHSGGSVTRGADDMLLTGAQSNNLLGADSGTIFIDGSHFATANDTASWDFANASNTEQFRVGASASFFFITDRVHSQGDILFYATTYKAAIRYSPSGLEVFVNGVKQTSSFANGDYTIDRLDYNGQGGRKTNFNQILYFPTTLSDADCITLTT